MCTLESIPVSVSLCIQDHVLICVCIRVPILVHICVHIRPYLPFHLPHRCKKDIDVDFGMGL